MPFRSACQNTNASGTNRNSARNAERSADQRHADPACVAARGKLPGTTMLESRTALVRGPRQACAPRRRRLHACSALIASSSTNETTSITTAIAVAPA